jgi:hypothetical protein
MMRADGHRASSAARRLAVVLTLICALLLALSGPEAQAQVGAAPGEWTSPSTIDPWLYPDSVSCPTASFCMAVGPDRGGMMATYDGSNWSAPTPIGATEVGAVSCTSASFCMAVGGKQALEFNGSTWSAPSTITRATWLRSVSCASASFCVALDNEGDALTYNGSSWGSPVSIDYGERLISVSCPSASFCMAVDSEGYAIRYDGTSWSAPEQASGWQFDSVSCASASLCIGGTHYFEIAYVYDGSSWHESKPEARVEGVSCYSGSFCVGVGEGEAVTYDGSSWSAATKIGIGADDVACGSQTSCVATSYDSKTAVSYQGGSWSAPVALGGLIESVSCPPSTSCVAVDDNGRALTFDGESWSPPQSVDGVIPLKSVSCPSDSFCMAVDEAGRALDRVDGVWGAPWKIDYEDSLRSVSCASSSFCSAVDWGGNAFIYENGAWGGGVKIDEGEGGQGLALKSVSCPSTTYCVAVDEWGSIFTYSAGSWSGPDAADSWGLMSVSCHSESFCAAADWQGRVLVGGGGSWGSPVSVAEELRSVSCPSSNSCVAVGVGMGWLSEVDHGYVAVLDGGAWAKAVSVDREVLTSVSCPSEAFCVAIDSDGNVLTAGVPSRRSVSSESSISPGIAGAAVPGVSGGPSKASFGKTKIGLVELRGVTVRVRVGCVGPSTAVCRVAVELRGRAVSHGGKPKPNRHASAIVGRTSVSLRGGQEKTASIRLNAVGRHLQIGHRRLSLGLVASQAEGGKTLVVSHRVISLRVS